VIFVRKKIRAGEQMKKVNCQIIILTATLLLGACTKIEQLPAVPSIEFTSFQFTFEDGDGDIGLKAPSEIQTDTTNLFFSLFRKTDGIMTPAPDNDPLKPSSYRIPYLEREGQNKILKGTISVTFMYLLYSESDTIKYDFYITDRAGNESNTASTSEIILTVNDTYKD
jgi:hypothetical protein